MTPHEFKAWFDGFTASDDGPPSLAKRSVINERVAEIDGFALNAEVFIEVFCPAALNDPLHAEIGSSAFDAETAMHALGKVESSVLFPTEGCSLPDSRLMVSV